MPSIPPRPGSGRSPLGVLAAIVRVPLYVVLGGLAVLVLSELPPLAGLLAGIGGDAAQVALLAGHWQSDSGAVCPDGLQEAEVNLAVARQAAALLREEGYRTEVLPEFAPKLVGFRAGAFVAIHSDSCVGDLSGFKVAYHADADPVGPGARLAAALSREYAAATGLAPHPNTITDDMRRYPRLAQDRVQYPRCDHRGGLSERRPRSAHRWARARCPGDRQRHRGLFGGRGGDASLTR